MEMKDTHSKARKTKKVILIRHSNAEAQSPEFSDFERSLTTKGKANAKMMAAILKSREKDPGILVTSPAFRAYETALIFNEAFGLDPGRVKLCRELYSGISNDDIISFFRSQNDDNDIITLFGHNSLISDMARALNSGATEDLPKTGIICLSFRAEKWNLIESGKGKVDYFLKPKSLL